MFEIFHNKSFLKKMYTSTAFNGMQLTLVKDARGLEASFHHHIFPFVQTLSSLLGKQSIPPLIQ